MARLFDGSNQYLMVAAAPVTVTPLSISLWFNKNDAGDDDCCICLSDGSSNNFFAITLNTGGGNFVDVRAYDGASGVARSTSAYSLDTWHHAAAVYTSSTLRAAWLDGMGKGTDATNVTPLGINQTDVGRHAGYGIYLSGAEVEVAVYDCALTDLEVWLLWRGIPPWRIRRSNLVGLWLPWGEQTNRDFSGRGRHMTAYNGPTFAADLPKIIGLSR